MNKVEPHGNEIFAYEWEQDGCAIRKGGYGSGMLLIDVAVGSVRHFDWPNRTHLGEFGILTASSSFRKEDCASRAGSAIPGNKLRGLRYRVGAVAPKSRDAVDLDGLHDQYIKSGRIIEWLLARVDQVKGTAASGDDPFCPVGAWDTCLEGW